MAKMPTVAAPREAELKLPRGKLPHLYNPGSMAKVGD